MEQREYHLVGVGGIGMSALARLLVQHGHRVTGSDRTASERLARLQEEGVELIPLAATPYTTLVRSSAVKEEHPEVMAARGAGCEVLHRSEMLARLMQGTHSILVAGTHGKTTTSSMLAWVLSCAGLDPSYALGGIMGGLGTNGRRGSGDLFVAEADESDGTLYAYKPQGAIVTGVEPDHMDYYQTEERLHDAFTSFLGRVEREAWLFWCGDDPFLSRQSLQGTSYGLEAGNALRAVDIQQGAVSTRFSVEGASGLRVELEVAALGLHNVRNATAVFGMASALGVDVEVIREGLRTFPGSARRCERKGEVRSVVVFDDYAHHPTEVATTLAGLRAASQGRRLLVCFQPHRYSRLQSFMEEFAVAFEDADELFITEVYGAGEEPIPGVDAAQLVKRVRESSVLSVEESSHQEVVELLARKVRPHDWVIFMGAGSVTELSGQLVDRLRRSPPRRYEVAVLCGGRSSEHAISLESSRNLFRRLRREIYEVNYLPIDRRGDLVSTGLLGRLLKSEVIVPVFHGPYGEDGMYAGLFESLGIPYVGCSYRSASVAMDKGATKRLVESHGIPTAPFLDFDRRDWRLQQKEWVAKAQRLLVPPLFVKPSHLGSSLGITRVERWESFVEAVESAFQVDSAIVVEQAVVGREIEFALLGNGTIEVPWPGEVLTEGRFYDYQAKYGPCSMPTCAVADLSCEEMERGRSLAQRVYQILGCEGLARIDFFLDRHGGWWLNEVNPFPGFTQISLYPKIWEAQGLSYEELIDRLVILALERARRGARGGGGGPH